MLGIAAIIVAVTGLMGGGVKAYIELRREMLAGFKQAAKDTQEVHVLVNKQLSDVMDKLTQMTGERDNLEDEKKERLRRDGD